MSKPNQFSRSKMVECGECGGDGMLSTSHSFTCYVCHGRGVISEYKRERDKARDAEWKQFEHKVIDQKVDKLIDQLRKQFDKKFNQKWPDVADKVV